VPTITYAVLQTAALLATIAFFLILIPGFRKVTRLNREFTRNEAWPKTARKLPRSERFSIGWQILRRRVTDPDPARAAHLVGYADYQIRKRARLDANGTGVSFQRRFYLYTAIAIALQAASIIAQAQVLPFDDPSTRTLVTIAGGVLVGCAVMLLVFRTLAQRVDNRDRATFQAVLDANPAP
jgi:hypothetical protein